MIFQKAFRWVLFGLLTAIVAGIGVWLFLWEKNGQLYETGIRAFGLRYAFLLVPLVINCVLAIIYNAESGPIPMPGLSIAINLVFPLVGTLANAIELFGISGKWYLLLQIAIPLALTYLMCLQCLLCPNEPPAPATPKRDNTQEVIRHIRGGHSNQSEPDPNQDADSRGLASGRGY